MNYVLFVSFIDILIDILFSLAHFATCENYAMHLLYFLTLFDHLLDLCVLLYIFSAGLCFSGDGSLCGTRASSNIIHKIVFFFLLWTSILKWSTVFGIQLIFQYSRKYTKYCLSKKDPHLIFNLFTMSQ